LRFGRLGDYPNRLNQFRNADVLICNTPGIVERVRQLGWKRRIEVVTNFTCTEQVAPIARSELNTPEGVPLVCSAGRMVPRKGFDTVIRAVATLADTYLWIVGDGPESSNLHRLVEELGMEGRLRFAGWRDDPRPYIAASDVFAMASRHEPLGNVILEGWAQRVPVVATRSEGPLWLIQDGENGLLADIEDHEQFAQAILRAMSDHNLAAKIVRGGKASLEERFSEQAVVDRYIQVLGGETVSSMAA
jgi:glycosyltransferase involved in cell wall biosynthesis